MIDSQDWSVHVSKPFHLEKHNKPHIEYISGTAFRNGKMMIMYGLHDKESKYLEISADDIRNLIR